MFTIHRYVNKFSASFYRAFINVKFVNLLVIIQFTAVKSIDFTTRIFITRLSFIEFQFLFLNCKMYVKLLTFKQRDF